MRICSPRESPTLAFYRQNLKSREENKNWIKITQQVHKRPVPHVKVIFLCKPSDVVKREAPRGIPQVSALRGFITSFEVV